MKIFNILILVFVTHIVVSTKVYSQDRVGHGGHADYADIISVHTNFTAFLKKKLRSGNNPWGLNLEHVIERIKSVKIECGVNLTLEGKKVDAINYPDDQDPIIKYDCESWRKLGARKKERLAIHELLWISGYDDSDYELSQKVFDDFVSELPDLMFANDQQFDVVTTTCNLERFQQIGGNTNATYPGSQLNILAISSLFDCFEIMNFLIQEGAGFGYCTTEQSDCLSLYYLRLIYLSKISPDRYRKHLAILSSVPSIREQLLMTKIVPCRIIPASSLGLIPTATNAEGCQEINLSEYLTQGLQLDEEMIEIPEELLLLFKND